MKYKILSHTADLRLEVYGGSLEELFNNAALALVNILAPKTKLKAKNQKSKIKIKVESNNINTLLVDFLNEILAKSNINKQVYKVYKVIKLKDDFIEAELAGRKIKEFEEDIKAVTYHEVNIRQTADGQRQKIWKTKLVFDI
jgi:SHS2 domain-containing protein